MNDNIKQTNNMSTFESSTGYNYGQFVVLSDTNEIMRYSRNGYAIYRTEDPPISPVKQKIISLEPRISDHESIPKYPQYHNAYSKIKRYSIELLYGTLAVLVLLITFTSFYILLVDKSY